MRYAIAYSPIVAMVAAVIGGVLWLRYNSREQVALRRRRRRNEGVGARR